MLKDFELLKYQRETRKRLGEITIPVEALNCRNLKCDQPDHKEQITKFYYCIIESLLRAGSFITKHVNNSHHQLPGWTEHVAELYDYSKTCHQLWREANEPRQGFIHSQYIRSRAKFKYANKNTCILVCQSNHVCKVG